jgi:hypothetical protein
VRDDVVLERSEHHEGRASAMFEAENRLSGYSTLEIATLLPMTEENLAPVGRNFENIC